MALGISTKEFFDKYLADGVPLGIDKFFGDIRGEKDVTLSAWKKPEGAEQTYMDNKVEMLREFTATFIIKNNPFVK